LFLQGAPPHQCKGKCPGWLKVMTVLGFVGLAQFFPPKAPLASTPCPPALVQVLEDERFLPAVLSSLERAQKEIWVGAYHFKTGGHPRSGPDRMAQELIRAAGRGVQVNVVLERPEDPLSEQARDNQRTASMLGRGGVRVYLERPEIRSHMKVVVVDGRFSMVGSHNLTRSGLRENHELSLSVDSPCVADRIVNYLKRIAREGGNRIP
jgi:phosphatidylserine/phosphatidylglycerophosphate/cardiolipin synthase-like enzyme